MAKHPLYRIAPYVRPYKFHLVVMFIGALGAQMVAASMPLVIERIIDDALNDRDRSDLYLWCAVFAVLAVVEPFLLFLRRFVLARASSEMETALRNDLYAHLQRLSLAFHGRWQSGQLLSRAIADANILFREFISFAAIYFVANIMTVVLVAVLLVLISPWLTLITACAAVPVAIASRLFKSHYLTTARRLQDQEGELGDYIEESALGVRVITTFGRVPLVQGQFEQRAATVRDTSYRANELRARFTALLGFVPNITLAAILGAGAYGVAHDELSVGSLVAFLSLLLILVWPIESLGEIMSITHAATAGATRIFEIFDVDPDITEHAGAAPVRSIEGRVRLRDVSFAYPDREPLLDDIDLEIAPGETVALVGRTGSGKSTLCSLIGRLQDVTSGSITIDDIDVRDFTLSSLRGHVGMAFEDPLLFSASVRENLLLGHHHVTDDDLRTALELAQASFVFDLPWGLDTRIGEQGLSLSGGQRQRLALARAVVGKPKVLVLDDPLSALDVHTEALVEAALARVLRDTTAIITAHRPSTIALADRVAFIHGGHIAAVGRHEELLEINATYRDLLSHADDGIVA